MELTRGRAAFLALSAFVAFGLNPQERTVARESVRVRLDRSLLDAASALADGSSTRIVWCIGARIDDAAGAWRGTSRDGGLRSYFTPRGVRVDPIGEGDWSWRVRARGYGRGDWVHDLPDCEPVVYADAVEYRRGDLCEWYVNDSVGLAQGLTLAAPPGPPSGEPATIELECGGNLAVEPTSGGDSLAFRDVCGERVLTCSHLAAWDARGRTLAARFDADGRRVRIAVDDRDAVYPITVDPLIVAQSAKLVPSNAASNRYVGIDVDIEGDRAVIVGGDPSIFLHDGDDWAYVFERVGGAWVEDAVIGWAPPGGWSATEFKSISLQGDSILVGDLWEPGGPWNGEAIVWTKRAGQWQLETYLRPHHGWWSYETTGWDVQLHGPYAFVGNPDHTHGSSSYQGCVYVYERDPANSNAFAYQTHVLSGIGYTGSSLAADGETLVAASAWNVLVYTGASATWTQQATLHPLTSFNPYLLKVALQGDTLVVGDKRGVGSADVYVRNGTTWTLQQTLTASAAAAGDGFGADVAFVGDAIAIGAPGDDAAGTDAGAVYLFSRNEGWQQQLKLAGNDTNAGDRFGTSVKGDVGELIVGAPYDAAPSANAGSAYIFDVSHTPAVVYCTAKVNSLGCVPHIGFAGFPSSSSTAPFTIRASNVLNGRNGCFYYGIGGRASAPFQGGTQCVASPVRRTPIISSGGNPPPDDCSGAFAIQFNAWIQSGVDPNLVVGTTVDLQCWSRDPASASATNLSDAVEFSIQP